jgi:hypothetical protein
VYEYREVRRALPPLVEATAELRALLWVFGGLGGALLVADLAAGHLGRLTTLEVADVIIVYGVSTGTTLAAVALGRFTGPKILYRNILDRAPDPPPQAHREAPRRTRTRGVLIGALTVVSFVAVAAIASGILLAVMGKEKSEIPDHLIAIAALIGGGWAVACAGAAWKVRAWLERWERLRHQRVLCPPLHAASLGEVYFTSDPAEPDQVQGGAGP